MYLKLADLITSEDVQEAVSSSLSYQGVHESAHVNEVALLQQGAVVNKSISFKLNPKFQTKAQVLTLTVVTRG